MPTQTTSVGMERKLAAILSADVAGYSHLMRTLAVVYSELGREAETRAEAAEILKVSPNFSLEGLRQRLPYKDPAETERVLAALRKAGLK